MDTVDVNVKDIILKPAKSVFNAIIEPEKMTKYFISKASGKMAEGKEIKWEFEDVGAKIDVTVLKIIENKQIIFEWNASGKSAKKVTISLDPESDEQTHIKITESSFEFTKEGIKKHWVRHKVGPILFVQ